MLRLNAEDEKVIIGRIPYKEDILKYLTNLCIENSITCGTVSCIGAVYKMTIGFYDQNLKKYENIVLNEPLEILSLIGNISLKEDKPFIHAHVTLGDKNGSAFGGHLFEGSEVFASEFEIRYFDSKRLIRNKDEITDLYLWS